MTVVFFISSFSVCHLQEEELRFFFLFSFIIFQSSRINQYYRQALFSNFTNKFLEKNDDIVYFNWDLLTKVEWQHNNGFVYQKYTKKCKSLIHSSLHWLRAIWLTLDEIPIQNAQCAKFFIHLFIKHLMSS